MMKKYLLSPRDIFAGVLMIAIGILFAGGFTIWTIITWCTTPEQHSLAEGVLGILVIDAVPLLFVLGGLLYCEHFKGCLYLFDDHIIIKKGRKEVEFAISQIRWIELMPDIRKGGYKASINPRKDFQYTIQLYDQKAPLDFFITNHIVLDVIKKHNIRIMPDFYNEVYRKTGTFDFREI